MAYVRTTWVDGTTVANAAKLNNIETELVALDAVQTPAVVNGQWLKGVGGVPVWSAIAVADLPAGTHAQICDLTLGGTQATIDTNTILGGNIPATYQHLCFRVVARGDTAAADTTLLMRLNNDSTAVYDDERIIVSGTGTISGSESLAATSLRVANIPANTAPASVFGTCVAELNDYRSTAHHKDFVSMMGSRRGTATGTILTACSAGGWKNTAAVTRITLLPGAGSFVTGTRFTLYGIT